MNINYDPQADVMYIQLRPGEVDYTREMESNFYVDFDQSQSPVGIEILSVRRFLAQNDGPHPLTPSPPGRGGITTKD